MLSLRSLVNIRKKLKKIYMIQTDVLSQHFPGHTEEYHKKYEHVKSLSSS